LRAHMFEVIDLGLNVRAERFIEEAVKNNAQVIGISSMMMHIALSAEGAKKVRKILKSHRLENSIKLIVGGSPYLFDANLYKKVEADAWAKDGISAVNVIKDLIKEIKK
jgi:methanogenic corrinoid protein MtbC1